jgi:hypothetical protein
MIKQITADNFEEKRSAKEYYGVHVNKMFPGNQGKGWISIDIGQFYQYTVFSTENIIQGGKYISYSKPTVKEVMRKLLADDKLIYRFDTSAELFEWLSK